MKKFPTSGAPTYLSSPEASTLLEDGGNLEVEVTVDNRPLTSQSDATRTLPLRFVLSLSPPTVGISCNKVSGLGLQFCHIKGLVTLKV